MPCPRDQFNRAVRFVYVVRVRTDRFPDTVFPFPFRHHYPRFVLWRAVVFRVGVAPSAVCAFFFIFIIPQHGRCVNQKWPKNVHVCAIRLHVRSRWPYEHMFGIRSQREHMFVLSFCGHSLTNDNSRRLSFVNGQRLTTVVYTLGRLDV